MNKIYLVTGPAGSGKTARLAAWCQGRTDAGGILQPVIDGKRYFEDVQSGRTFLLEAGEREKKVYKAGDKRYATAAYAWASELLTEAPEKPGIKYLLIDEIGAPELKGEGLAFVLTGLFEFPLPGVSLVVVVRDELLAKVLKRYRLKDRAVPFTFPE